MAAHMIPSKSLAGRTGGQPERFSRTGPRPGYQFDWTAPAGRGKVDADLLLLTGRGSPDRVRALLPAGMEPTGRVLIYMAWMQERTARSTGSSWPFRELGLAIEARSSGEQDVDLVFHAPLFVDDPLAAIRGPEGIVGPRRLAEICVDPVGLGDRDRAFSVHHGGRSVVSATLRDLRAITTKEFPVCGTRFPVQRAAATGRGQSVPGLDVQRTRLDFQVRGTMKGAASIDIHPDAFGGVDIGPLDGLHGYAGGCRVLLHAATPFGVKAWSMTA
ncbi:acetoacetate decarboxylase family protein [Modestobacter lapidis]|nr:acetoacetate decarboxylase family protein [Modestobacter lapidis]